jgi:hypothetical protein
MMEKDVKNNEVIDRFMTSGELAALVRVPVETVRYWRHVGKGPTSFRLPGTRRVLYAREDVESFIRAAKNGDQPSADEQEPEKPLSLDDPIFALPLPQYARNRLIRWMVKLNGMCDVPIRELTALTDAELLDMHGVSWKTISAIDATLAAAGFERATRNS